MSGWYGWGWAVQRGELVAVLKLNVFREREVFGSTPGRDRVWLTEITVGIHLYKTDSQLYVHFEDLS